MLPKQFDSCDVKDPRAIVLLDYEANHTYKRIGRESTRAAVDHENIFLE